MTCPEVIVRDEMTGLFGFRVEMGRDRNGTRMQARRGGFVTERAALGEYRRLCRQRDAGGARPRLSDAVRSVCETWLYTREQELQPNTLYCYTWLLSLLYPFVGQVRSSRLSARMVEHAYRACQENCVTVLYGLTMTHRWGYGLGKNKSRELRACFQPWMAAPSTRRPGATRLFLSMPASAARARARLSSMSAMASQMSLMAASSVGKCPRFLMIFRIWKLNDSIALVV